MIFLDDSLNRQGEVVSLGTYHPYWLDKWAREKNPAFDQRSARILDLKEAKEAAADFFFNELDPILGTGFALCVVPSHDPENQATGISMLARRLARASKGRTDAVECLRRVQKIEKLARGGDRDERVHMETIRVFRRRLIEGRQVLLLDDVTTTGNSLLACRQLLLESGATEVQPVALGKTA